MRPRARLTRVYRISVAMDGRAEGRHRTERWGSVWAAAPAPRPLHQSKETGMKRILLISALLASAWALSCGPAAAQEVTTGTIEGTVTDPHGAALAGATVTITSAQGSRSVTSDANGRFRLPYLTAGTYSLTATLPGYNSVERPNLDVRLGSPI